MARQEFVLSVFVASPSDVTDERDRLEEVISEINLIWSRTLGVRLELIKWETHAYPSFGDDAQAVINSQIPDDYDLFIGILWSRYGTPTKRAGSGTIEEFERARTRYFADKNAVQLMIYFKDEKIAPSKIDPKQLELIANFRESLGNLGLYWPFQTTDEFATLIKLHLSRQMQEWINREKQAPSSSLPRISDVAHNPVTADSTIEESGLLELLEKFEDEFDALTEIAGHIADAIREIGEKMQERTNEANQFNAGPDNKNRKSAIRIISKAATDMNQFTHRMESELPLFSLHLNEGMTAITKAASILIEFENNDETRLQANENLVALRSFNQTMKSVEAQVADFQLTVDHLPRMTSELNRSKRAMSNVLKRLLSDLQSAQAMSTEAETSFGLIVGENNHTNPQN